MKNKFKLGQKVIINTGGEDTIAHIDEPTKNIHGYYWPQQDLYLCRFTDDDRKLLCNGAVIMEGHFFDKTKHYVCKNAQYIPADCIKPFIYQYKPLNN